MCRFCGRTPCSCIDFEKKERISMPISSKDFSIPVQSAGLCNNDHVFDITNRKCPKCESEHYILLFNIFKSNKEETK